MPKLDIYSLWIDPVFYVSAFAFALFLILLIYSVRRYIEASNAAEDGIMEEEINRDMEDSAGLSGETLAATKSDEQEMENLVEEEPFEKTVVAQESEMPMETDSAYENPESIAEQIPVGEDVSKAGEFVKGIFNGISDIDERLKSVEKTLAARKLNADFALRLLEDILEEYDSINKEEIKVKIKYLVDDLKK